MFQRQESIGKKTSEKSFPADADVKVSVEGLAFCYMKPKMSKIHFLSHVPFHKLNLKVEQKRRDSDEKSLLLETVIEPKHTVSIKTDNAVTPDDVSTGGNYPLNEIVNINSLHDGKIIKRNFPPKLAPITLSVNDCAFYTEAMTEDEFDIIKTGETPGNNTVETRKIGYVMSGKIKCDEMSGSITIEVKGSHPFKIKRPMSDAGGDFIYEISLSNHCVEEAGCKELAKEGSDFRFYYDLLVDSENPRKKFEIKKASSGSKTITGMDVMACNVVIVQPPPS